MSINTVDPSTGLPAWLAQQLAAQGRGMASRPPGQAGAGAAGAMSWLDYINDMFAPGGVGASGANLPAPNAQPMAFQGPAGGDFNVPPGPGNVNTVNPGGPLRPDPSQTPPNPRPIAPVAPGSPLSTTFPTGLPPMPTPGPAGGPSAPPSGSGYGALGPAGWGAKPLQGPPAPPQNVPLGAPAGTPTVNPATTAGANPQQPQGRFAQVDRPNAPAGGGAWTGGGPRQMTALNLAGLFGGGVNPNAPAPNAQPVSSSRPPGPLAQGSNVTRAPWSYGPFQKGGMGPRMPLAPGYQSQTPDQVAGAVRQPNWWNFGW